MSDKQNTAISAAQLAALAAAYKNAEPVIKDAASLARAAAGIMERKAHSQGSSTGHFVKGK